MRPLPSQASQHTHQTTAFITSLLSNSRNTSAPGFVFPICFTKKWFYATPGTDVVLKQTEMNFGEMSVYARSHFIKPVRLQALLWALYLDKERNNTGLVFYCISGGDCTQQDYDYMMTDLAWGRGKYANHLWVSYVILLCKLKLLF